LWANLRMMVAIVTPSGRPSIASTRDCFEPRQLSRSEPVFFFGLARRCLICLWPRNPVSRQRRLSSAETRFECGATARAVQASGAGATIRQAKRRDGQLRQFGFAVVDLADERGQSALGCTAHSWRTVGYGCYRMRIGPLAGTGRTAPSPAAHLGAFTFDQAVLGRIALG
jgi:hypothetical protein